MAFLKIRRRCPRCWSQCHHELITAMGKTDLRLVGPDCAYCDNQRDVVDLLDVLASNLATAAALCASFEMGRDYEYTMQLLPGRFSRRASANHEWRPGCGRRAR